MASLPGIANETVKPSLPVEETPADGDAETTVSVPQVKEESHGPPKPDNKLCGVCNEHQAKYKCSRCEIPYCSVACAAQHRAIPCEASAAKKPAPRPDEATVSNESARPLPGTVGAAGATNIFSVLDNSQKLQALFVRYPRLRAQLREIHNATLPPADNAGLDSSHEDSSVQQSQGNRGGKSGVGRGGPTRQQGQWNSDRGTENGIDSLSRAKLEYGKAGEGVREYADLVLKLVAADGVDVARLVQDEVTEENARIIGQLLNGDA